jgi:hypothetical protein
MEMDSYGDSYKGNDEPIFVGILTFLKLPWIRSLEELKKVGTVLKAEGSILKWNTEFVI